MRKFTHLIDGVDNIDMTWDRWYKNVRSCSSLRFLSPGHRQRSTALQIVPIGFMFSCSLIFSNLAYLTLSVSFIQMYVKSPACRRNKLTSNPSQAQGVHIGCRPPHVGRDGPRHV